MNVWSFYSFFLSINNKEASKLGNSTNLNPKFYETFTLDFEAFKTSLENAPVRTANTISNTRIVLPNVDGKMETFVVYEAPILSQELSLLYPEIKVSYRNIF